jgi:hypothetical protein
VDLAPGQAAFVQFDFDRVLAQFGQRLQLRPVVVPLYEGSALGCIASAEMIDQFSGRTAAYAAQQPPPIGEHPPPVPDFGMVGGALLQIIRLNLVAWPPGPVRSCNATLGFAAADGSALGRSSSVDLAPGQAAHLDLPMSGYNLRLGERVQIRPTLQEAAPGSAAGCVATVEVFDVASGRTTTFVLPTGLPDRPAVGGQ